MLFKTLNSINYRGELRKMKFLSCIAIAVAMSGFTSCGIINHDDDSPSGSGAPNVNSFGLTGTETTTLDANALRNAVNNFSILTKIDLANTNKDAKKLASFISRGKAKNFEACVKKKLDSVPLEVTGDTVSYTFDYDFITLCDDAAKPDDLVEEIKNRMTGTVIIGCGGGDFSKLKNGEAKDLTQSAELCKDAQSVKFFYNFTVDARITTKTKNGTEYEVTDVHSAKGSSSLAAATGGPCVLTVTDKKFRHVDSCEAIDQLKRYDGAPKFESNSPVIHKDEHEKEDRPRVIQSKATVSNAVIETDAPYYKAPTNTTFVINGWNGTVNYSNGWAGPTWTATKDSEKAGGEIGNNAAVTPQQPGRGQTTDQPTTTTPDAQPAREL